MMKNERNDKQENAKFQTFCLAQHGNAWVGVNTDNKIE